MISENRHNREPRAQLRQKLGARLGRSQQRVSQCGAFDRNIGTVTKSPVKTISRDAGLLTISMAARIGTDGVFVVVKVAELCDSQAIESRWQPRQHNFNGVRMGWFGSRNTLSSPRASAPVAATPAAT